MSGLFSCRGCSPSAAQVPAGRLDRLKDVDEEDVEEESVGEGRKERKLCTRRNDRADR